MSGERRIHAKVSPLWHPNAKSSMTNVKKVDTKSWQLLMWLSHDQPSTNYNDGRILPTQFFTHLIILADTDLMQTNERQNWRRMWTRFFILLRAGFETGKWQFLVQVRSRESHFFASLSRLLKFSLRPIFIAPIHFLPFCSHWKEIIFLAFWASFQIQLSFPRFDPRLRIK